ARRVPTPVQPGRRPRSGSGHVPAFPAHRRCSVGFGNSSCQRQSKQELLSYDGSICGCLSVTAESDRTGAAVIDQPYAYQRRELTEPDWRRFPGWAEVTAAQWESAQWQRSHCVKNLRQLREVDGPGLSDAFCADLERDQRERATMSMLVPPQMLK